MFIYVYIYHIYICIYICSSHNNEKMETILANAIGWVLILITKTPRFSHLCLIKPSQRHSRNYDPHLQDVEMEIEKD